MNTFKIGLLLTIMLAAAPISNLSANEGKATYNENCTGCHGTEVFTRSDRKVKNLAGLKSRVRQCSYAIESKWFDDDVDAVADYLNNAFYKF